MKNSKLTKLEQKITECEAEKKEILSQVDAGKILLAEQRRQAEAAAAEGDVEKYRKLKAAADATEDELYVKRAQAGRIEAAVNKNDVFAAWGEIAEEFNQEKDKRVKTVIDKRKDIAKALSDCVKLQNEMLLLRSRCARLSSGNSAPFTFESVTNGLSCADAPAGIQISASAIPEIEYLKRAGVLSREEFTTTSNILNGIPQNIN